MLFLTRHSFCAILWHISSNHLDEVSDFTMHCCTTLILEWHWLIYGESCWVVLGRHVLGISLVLNFSSILILRAIGIPYHTIPYHTIPYHTIPYHTIPYHTTPSIPYLTVPYHIIYQTRPDQTRPDWTMFYYVLLFYIQLCALLECKIFLSCL
jgi:hypothetical protein